MKALGEDNFRDRTSILLYYPGPELADYGVARLNQKVVEWEVQSSTFPHH